MFSVAAAKSFLRPLVPQSQVTANGAEQSDDCHQAHGELGGDFRWGGDHHIDDQAYFQYEQQPVA
jgi:hypothetical protein